MTSSRPGEKEVLVWLAIAAAIAALLYLLAPILSPFLFGAILAYICHPLVDRLAKRKVPRGVAAGLVIALLAALAVALVLIMLPLLVRQVRASAEQLPVFLDWLRTRLEPWVGATFGIELDMQLAKDWLLDNATGIQSFAMKLL